MSDRSVSKWKVGNGRMYAHKKDDEVKALTTTYARKRVVKLAKTLILKESLTELEGQKREMQELILAGNNIDIQKKLMENQLHYNSMILMVLDELMAYEKGKVHPNREILQWCVDKLLDMKKADAEIRKTNEGQFEMKFGKKKVNIDLKSDKSIEEWLGEKKPIDVEAEVIEEDNVTDKGKDKKSNV